jgi:FkbM family methyltransferase
MKSIAKKAIKYFYVKLPYGGKEAIHEECSQYLSNSFWEQIQLKKVLQCYNIDCFFDVGANEGKYALMLRNKIKFKGVIISFEPIHEAAEKIRKLSANDPLWIVEECALSNTIGEAKFNVMVNSQFSSLSNPNHDEVKLFEEMNAVSKEIVVDTKTLDSVYYELHRLFKFKRPFLKLDTQGFDIEIVRNGKTVMKNFIGLQSELAIKKLYDSSIFYQDAINYYQGIGFSLSSLVPNNEGHFPILVEIDCIMIRNDLL